ncbi:hypothetical protein LguiB_005263 [Lonicera macranthoides]
MEKVDREMLNKLGLCSAELIRNLKLNFVYNSMYGYKVSEDIRQGFYEFGIFSTFLQREEIPSWCGDRNNKGSSSISFVVPSQPSLRITGLNVYSVYTLSNSNTDEIGCSHILFTKISNKTKDLKWIYTPVAIAIPKKKNEDEDQLVWLSHWKFENHLESGDEVDISVIAGEALKLKEFGINLVWGEEEKGQIKAIHCHHHNNAGEVIGGDLSNYQFMSRRHFFLCHHYMHPYFTKISIGMFREVFGDHVTYEGSKDYMSERFLFDRRDYLVYIWASFDSDSAKSMDSAVTPLSRSRRVNHDPLLPESTRPSLSPESTLREDPIFCTQDNNQPEE